MRVRVQLSKHTHTYVEVPGPAMRPQCVHLGEPVRREDGLRETVECKPCSAKSGKTISLPVMGCAIHGQCTVAKPVGDLRWCGKCAERTP